MKPNEGSALECAPPNTRRATFTYILHTAIVVGGLLGGGISVGYYFGMQSQRDDSLAEIARLQQSHYAALDALAGRQARTAARLDTAATTLSEAAGTAAVAAETAQAAAATAGKAAKAAGVPAAAIEQDRKAINSAIGKANARIGEGAR